jgi:hypothetical protein
MIEIQMNMGKSGEIMTKVTFNQFALATVMILILIMGIAAATSDDTNSVCNWDWKWYPASHIGDTKAPVGYEYIVATLYLKNIGDQKITTSQNGWNLIANGLKYEHDTNTFNGLVGHQDIEIVKGGDIETKIVYLVKGHPTHCQLQYDGKWGTGLSVAKINYYGNQSGL